MTWLGRKYRQQHGQVTKHWNGAVKSWVLFLCTSLMVITWHLRLRSSLCEMVVGLLISFFRYFEIYC